MDDEEFHTWLDRHAVAAWKAIETAHNLARADLYRDSGRAPGGKAVADRADVAEHLPQQP
jgi:hypothetical protein